MRIALPVNLSLPGPSSGAGGTVVAWGGATIGTTWSVRAVASSGMAIEGGEQAIAGLLAIIIAQMSNWETASDISRFNHGPIGRWRDMPSLFLHVLRHALDIAARSGGAFDPAIGGLVERWGFGPSATVDASAMIDAPATPRLREGWTSIAVQGHQVRRTADIALDFSGIAKGFAVDAISKLLTERGLPHHLVEIGGELRGAGLRPDGQPWWVDLEVPPGLDIRPVRLGLTGLSVATSGDYRRYFESGGVRLSHNMDPRTGAPVRNGVASVTVCDVSAMRADAWATALCVLGAENGMTLARRERLAAMIVVRDGEGGGGRELLSPAFARMMA